MIEGGHSIKTKKGGAIFDVPAVEAESCRLCSLPTRGSLDWLSNRVLCIGHKACTSVCYQGQTVTASPIPPLKGGTAGSLRLPQKPSALDLTEMATNKHPSHTALEGPTDLRPEKLSWLAIKKFQKIRILESAPLHFLTGGARQVVCPGGLLGSRGCGAATRELSLVGPRGRKRSAHPGKRSLPSNRDLWFWCHGLSDLVCGEWLRRNEQRRTEGGSHVSSTRLVPHPHPRLGIRFRGSHSTVLVCN